MVSYEKWSESRYIPKAEPTSLAAVLDVRSGKK